MASKRSAKSRHSEDSTSPKGNANHSHSAESEEAAAAQAMQLQLAFANLQLPHMPKVSPASISIDSSKPLLEATLRILVVADLDLSSASELAEYTVRQKKYGVFDADHIDLCIACGPFCRDDDLLPYERGRQQQLSYKASKRRRSLPQQPPHKPFQSARHRSATAPARTHSGSMQHSPTAKPQPDWTATPFFRTLEQTAALDGLMTAALSQLESIVCRVAYCPGSSDPLTVFSQSPSITSPSNLTHCRLTPNSRNIHQQWLPLAPALGCAGLFYLDAASEVLLHKKNNASKPNAYVRNDSKDLEESDASEEETENDESDRLSREFQSLRQGKEGYFATLSRLLRLATSVRGRIELPPFRSPRAQSILVTHYTDARALTGIQPDPFPNGSPSWAEETARHSPWPGDRRSLIHRQEFMEQNRDSLCLEIASGAAFQHKAQWIRPSNKKKGNASASIPDVLLPGSLRERGEFSIVHVGLAPIPSSSPPTTSQPSYLWKVLDVEFHQLHDYLDE